MNVAIIGCGLIGKKRALALEKDDKLVACCDVNEEIGKNFADQFKCNFYTDYKKIFDEDVDIVIISVINKFMKNIVIDALSNGKHIIVEKPLGRNYGESKEMIEKYEEMLKLFPNLKFKVGFNHRFHPAIFKAKELVNDGLIGKVFSIRARYGHGGRSGMEREWRASKDLCGGGELLDQGVHIIDLIRWFGGEIVKSVGILRTKFWNMEVEDNAYAILETVNNVTAQFNVSWTNWKNIFSFEIFGGKGYIHINGLGGSYGIEKLEIGRRRHEGGRPFVTIEEFPPEDESWRKEWLEFKSAISENREVLGNHLDGLNANKVIQEIYSSSSLI